MVTKLIAAEIATCAGCHVVISIGSDPKRILGIIDSFEKEKIVQQGTIFVGKEKPTTDRKWWMHGLATYGELEIDNGAAAAIKNNQSLFAAGIVRITGTFNAQQCVILKCKDEIGRGLVNYSSQDISKIIGKSSTEIAQILGFRETEHVIHRDNIVLKR
jgi:glutamate 5-kinase